MISFTSKSQTAEKGPASKLINEVAMLIPHVEKLVIVGLSAPVTNLAKAIMDVGKPIVFKEEGHGEVVKLAAQQNCAFDRFDFKPFLPNGNVAFLLSPLHVRMGAGPARADGASMRLREATQFLEGTRKRVAFVDVALEDGSPVGVPPDTAPPQSITIDLTEEEEETPPAKRQSRGRLLSLSSDSEDSADEE